MTRTNVTTQLFVVFLILVSNIAYAEDCTPWVAKAISVQGNVERRSNTDQASSQWQPIKRDDALCAGEMVRVKQNSRAALILKNDTILRLNQNTTITLSSLSEDQSHWINLEQGIAHFIARIEQSFKVITPFVNAAVEGTEFVVNVNENQTEVTVFEGKVNVKNDLGEVRLTKGQTAVATVQSIPTIAVRVKPRNAVQWSLYYPAIINLDSSLNQDLDPDSKIIIERSIAAAQDGQFTTALEQIVLIRKEDINTTLLTYRASLYLAVGRIEKAKLDIKQVLKIQPDNAQAIALQAIFAIVQNDKTNALALAEQAATLEPNRASVALALSYVHQSLFDINNALQIIKKSTATNEDNALLWSRLSELYLMVGDLNKALETAKKANRLNPNIARTHSTLGFAYLTRIEVKKAEQAFKDAIEKDDTDPLSRLGLGLAIIRQGKLEEGRRQIEFAATLDPNNALIRSYLGKAYYEEKRAELAAVQFNMAKLLDQNDPTAYYYDAILKQSINRPIPALKELEKSITLNDNRAIYRSTLQLDQDEAVRSVSIARIYNNIGFEQLALQEGWKSINSDPSNSSAHRLLADSYINLPRHEIARVSELLQAQLLQPLNLNPIQPQLSISHLGILDGVGPSETSYSEFNPLFTKNNFNVLLNAITGNQNTKGADIVLSGLYNRVSYSIGKFNYKTDGFRPNNDLEHDNYNAFIQFKVSNNLNLQAETRKEELKSGDLLMAFDNSIYQPNKRKIINTKINRVGFNYNPGLNHTLLGSYIESDRFEKKSDSSITPAPPFPVENNTLTTEDEQAKSIELQYIYDSKKFTVTTGAVDIDLEHLQIYSLKQTVIPPGPPILIPDEIFPSNFDTNHKTVYVYNNFTVLNNSILTLGLSVDDYTIQKKKNSAVNPKVGIEYKINTNTVLRLAAFSTVVRPITANQSIEPTSIAGFNQFFEDFRNAEIKRYGFAIDHLFSKNIKASIEPSLRSLSVPVTDSNINVTYDKYDEQTFRAYLYFIINNDITFATEFYFERFNRDLNNKNNKSPLDLKTYRLPFKFNYSTSYGLSVQLTSSYFDQEYQDENYKVMSDDFWITDLSILYRLPKRVGVISLGAKNLFDRKFNFYDLEFTGTPRTPFIQPERSLFTKISISY